MPDPVVLAGAERQYRRGELDTLIAGFAAELADRGVRPGDRVALMSSNRPEFVMALYGIWRAGAAVVLLSPAWKHHEVAHALALTEPVAAVGDHPALAELRAMRHLDEPITPVAGPAPFAADPEAEAVLVFSSGTTGTPKAVRHTHRSFAAGVEHWRTALGLHADDRMQVVTPPSHILGLLNIAAILDAGGWVRLRRRFDVDELLAGIAADRITVEMAVAPIALAIAAHPDLECYDLSSLRYIMWCATPITPAVAEVVTRRTGVTWMTGYGATELPVLACNEVGSGLLDTVGRAAPGVQLRIRSTDTGTEVGPDVPGEIWARADSLMAGYLPAEATAEVIVDGWYRTGDIGVLDADGWLRITDRTREMIKVRGFQVAPAEVESVLHAHPAVADCAVFGAPVPVADTDGPALTGQEQVIAAVATLPGADVSAGELQDLVAARLASYKRPAEIVFVSEIPRLPSGKVLRRVLKESHGCPTDR